MAKFQLTNFVAFAHILNSHYKHVLTAGVACVLENFDAHHRGDGDAREDGKLLKASV